VHSVPLETQDYSIVWFICENKQATEGYPSMTRSPARSALAVQPKQYAQDNQHESIFEPNSQQLLADQSHETHALLPKK
jgi:hypothetical protein